MSDSLDDFIFGRGPSLRRRVLYTLLLLLIFRVLAGISILNVDEERMNRLLADNPFLGSIDLLAGGKVLAHFSIVAAGILPYLLALGLTHLGAAAIFKWRGILVEIGHEKARIQKIATVLTIPLAFILAFVICKYLSREIGLFPGRIHWFTRDTFLPSMGIVLAVTIGSLVSTFIVHLITKKGFGDGHNIVLLASASFGFLTQLLAIANQSQVWFAVARVAGVVAGAFAIIVFGIYLLNSTRRIEVGSARRTPARRLPRSSSYIPLRLSSGGTQPIAAAIGFLALLTLAQVTIQSYLGGSVAAVTDSLTHWNTPTSSWYWVAVSGLIVLSAVAFNFRIIWHPYSDSDVSISEQLRREGGFVVGVRPGKQTDEYLSRVTAAITVLGTIGLLLLGAVLPYIVQRVTGQNVVETLLSLMLVIGTVDKLIDLYRARRGMLSYEGFLGTSRKK